MKRRYEIRVKKTGKCTVSLNDEVIADGITYEHAAALVGSESDHDALAAKRLGLEMRLESRSYANNYVAYEYRIG